MFECAECGHLHYLGAVQGYAPCPVCGCAGQPWAREALRDELLSRAAQAGREAYPRETGGGKLPLIRRVLQRLTRPAAAYRPLYQTERHTWPHEASVVAHWDKEHTLLAELANNAETLLVVVSGHRADDGRTLLKVGYAIRGLTPEDGDYRGAAVELLRAVAGAVKDETDRLAQ